MSAQAADPPLMRALFDSVAPDVKMISLGSALMTPATCSLAFSTAALVSHPYRCVVECGLPYCSVRYGIMASRTRGSIGVVACMSRYIDRVSMSRPLYEYMGAGGDPDAVDRARRARRQARPIMTAAFGIDARPTPPRTNCTRRC